MRESKKLTENQTKMINNLVGPIQYKMVGVIDLEVCTRGGGSN